jgi:nitroimidazol reductase NimA-like FMN-containing flavoprotein (pyridoxamine 5'-phosphate oxidase superfamily)
MRRNERQITDNAEIESIIRSSDVCRVAMANDNIPYIVTMNFGYAGGEKPCLYFHCAPAGRKLEMISRNKYVCFEMDTGHEIYKGDKGCDWGMNYSSIVGFGNLSVVDDFDERISGLRHIMDHYGGSGEYSFDDTVLARTIILKLDISEIACKKK